MKQFYILIIAVFFASHASSQGYNYLRILQSFPSIPENTLTASKEEKESFKDKLEVINSLLYDLEDAQKEEIRKSENEPLSFDLNDKQKFDAMVAAQEEYEELLEACLNETMTYLMIDVEISAQHREILDSVFLLNEPLFAQLQNTGNEDQIRKQIYINRLNANRPLVAKHRSNIINLKNKCESLAPAVNKLDNFSIDGQNIIPSKAGLNILRQLYNVIEFTYSYNVGTENDLSPYDMGLEMKNLLEKLQW